VTQATYSEIPTSIVPPPPSRKNSRARADLREAEAFARSAMERLKAQRIASLIPLADASAEDVARAGEIMGKRVVGRVGR
jgi:hypothetical protein